MVLAQAIQAGHATVGWRDSCGGHADLVRPDQHICGLHATALIDVEGRLHQAALRVTCGADGGVAQLLHAERVVGHHESREATAVSHSAASEADLRR
eukprot:scaffold39238_cov36-Phaeocystis_antarctica.AAC.3